jgi:hypothetical protein
MKSFLFLSVLCLFFFSCGKNPEVLAGKLDSVLQEDLKYIVAEVQKGSGKKHLIEKPYYVVEKYKVYEGDTARIIAAYAVAHFYYFKDDIGIYQKRHYRYWSDKNYWDRERKSMEFVKPQTQK